MFICINPTKCKRIIAVSILTFTIANSFSFSQEKVLESDKWNFSISGGALLPGNIQGSYESDFNPDSTIDIKSKSSPLLKFTVDYHVLPKLSVGVNVNYAVLAFKDVLYKGESILEEGADKIYLGRWDGKKWYVPMEDIKMLELNASVKGRFQLGQSFVLKPCLYAGYRQTYSEEEAAQERGVVLNYNAEALYYLPTETPLYLLGDFGFFSQPYGGVSDVGYVRAFAVPYFTIGLGVAL